MPRYLKDTLDQYVESDYTIVYFHYGLNSQNKPALHWLRTAYKEFDRKCVPSAPRAGRLCGGRGPETGPGAAQRGVPTGPAVSAPALQAVGSLWQPRDSAEQREQPGQRVNTQAGAPADRSRSDSETGTSFRFHVLS